MLPAAKGSDGELTDQASVPRDYKNPAERPRARRENKVGRALKILLENRVTSRLRLIKLAPRKYTWNVRRRQREAPPDVGEKLQGKPQVEPWNGPLTVPR